MYLWPFGHPHAQYTAPKESIYKYKFGECTGKRKERISLTYVYKRKRFCECRKYKLEFDIRQKRKESLGLIEKLK